MNPDDLHSRLEDVEQSADFGSDAPNGLYLDVPEEQYHDHPAISRSILAKAAYRSPLHALHDWRKEENESTDAMDLGTAAHRRVLEPEVFERRYDVAADQCEGVKADGERCGNSAKVRHNGAWYCGVHAPDGEPDDIEVLKSKHYYAAKGIAKALRNDTDANPLLFGLPGLEEATILFEDPKTGMQMRARLDRLVCLPDKGVSIVDLKTTRSAHPQDFRRKYGRNGYWLQPPFYSYAVNQLPIDLTVRDFVFLTVESSKPYAVQAYRPEDDERRAAAKRMGGLVEQMEDAVETPPGSYRDGIATIGLRRYQKDRLALS